MAKVLGANSIYPILSCRARSVYLSSQFQRSHIRNPLLSTQCVVAEKTELKEEEEEKVMSIENLHRFFDINLGKWNGSFYQFDTQGNLLQTIPTKLSASTYGEDELISLIQSLYVKQPPSNTTISGREEEPEWIEYKIKETNLFTVDKYQQIGFFPNEKAFSLRYQTIGMLENVLRIGVLGEDDTGEDNPKNLKIPCRRPSIVCESCLYSLTNNARIRAFHVLDPKGIQEMLMLFVEEKGNEIPWISNPEQDLDRISPFLGKWRGKSVTKRSGVYGSTIAEADTFCSLEINDLGQVIQHISSTPVGTDKTSNVHWTGSLSNNMVKFELGFEMTFLPLGIYMGCPSDVGKSVGRTEPFHLELCWMESEDKRQRLVRTYDWDGMAVSSTYFYEIRV